MTWHKMSLGEVITLQRGYDLPESKRFPGNIPVVTSSGVSGWHSQSPVRAPGVVTGRYGTLGQVFYLRQDFWPHNTTLFVKDFKGNDPKFVYYLLKGLNLGNQSSATSVPGLDRNTLHKIPVRIPEVPVQHRIAEILGSLDDKIECNRRMNKTLEAMAQALYRHWFVDRGGPTLVPLTHLIEVDPPVYIPKGKEVPYVDMKALPMASMSVTEVRKRPFTSGSKFQNGDTLFARITPCLENGKTAFVDFLQRDEAGYGSTEFIVLRGKSGISPQYVHCTARDERLRAHAIKSMVGTSGRQRVRSDCFSRFQVRSFSEETMRAFHERTDAWFKQIRVNVKENQVLAITRDYLLPKLLSGNVQVKAVENKVGAML